MRHGIQQYCMSNGSRYSLPYWANHEVDAEEQAMEVRDQGPLRGRSFFWDALNRRGLTQLNQHKPKVARWV